MAKAPIEHGVSNAASQLAAAESLANLPTTATTHDLAKALLALPALPLQRIEQQGGPESWSDQLHPDVEVQVGIRTW